MMDFLPTWSKIVITDMTHRHGGPFDRMVQKWVDQFTMDLFTVDVFTVDLFTMDLFTEYRYSSTIIAVTT